MAGAQADVETVAIGSVLVEVMASGRYREAVRARFGSTPRRDGDPELQLVLGPDRPVPPSDEPDEETELTCWTLADEHWVRVGEAVAHLVGSTVTIGGPADTDDDMAALDMLCQSLAAVAFARPDRAVVHGAAVSRGEGSLLVVGPSGAGKSTTAAAALRAGWELLSDDLVVVDLDPARLTGVRRAPMFPAGLLDGSAFGARAEAVSSDPRRRVRLPAEVLSARTSPLVAIVVVAHGEGDGGLDRLEPGDLDVLTGALAVQPYPPFMRRQFPALVRIVGLPTYRLRHAEEPDLRLERAAARLDEALGDALGRS